MPEGPEIRREADKIAAAVADQPLTGVEFFVPRLSHRAPELAESRIVVVEARGKALLTRFENGLTLYSHNQLYGRWYVTRRGKTPSTRRSLRVALHGRSRSAFLYSATDIDVLTDEELTVHPFLTRLGPDVLNEPLQAKDILRRLQQRPFSGRQLGALYLDQSFLAGLGNYLRSEILFTSRVHPARRARDLDRAEASRLARETLKLPKRSYDTRGLTVPKSHAARRRREGFEGYRFWVFGRDGRPCQRCETTIERIDVAGRRLYLCPACQSATL